MLRRRAGLALAASLVVSSLVASSPARAQEIVLDRFVALGDVVAFESRSEPGAYYYAPTRARLARGSEGRPRFSFLRYVERADAGVDEGTGGGIVHAVVELGLTDGEVAKAESALRAAVPGARLAGPVIFRSGRFGLVSSFAQEDGELTRRVVGLGTAPVLDGGKAAVSMQLTKLGAKVLWESFHSATPDVSFQFEMEVAGYRAPKQVRIEADFERVYEHRRVNEAVATPVLQAEIDEAFDDLYAEGAIRVEIVGDDAELSAMREQAFAMLRDLVFQPASPTPTAGAEGERRSALDRATELLERRREEARDANALAAQRREELAASGYEYDALAEAFPLVFAAPAPATGVDPVTQEALPELAAVALWERKRSRQRGTYRVDLDKYTADTQALRFDENVGDLTRHLDDAEVFRSVNLDDPMFRQRTIVASLQGVNAAAFEDEIAYVTVQFRKRHESGALTVEDLTIDRGALDRAGNRFDFVYGWKGDADRDRWNDYETRTVWGYHGAPSIEAPWTVRREAVIPLRPPLQRRRVALEVFDHDALAAAGVRSVSVKTTSAIGDASQERQVTLNTARGELSSSIELLVPADATTYDYEIVWRLKGNRSITTGPQRGDQDILYLDELPEAS
ncbi:MAG: hypothetical protein R3E88_14540 [Myxococcota bacterium]